MEISQVMRNGSFYVVSLGEYGMYKMAIKKAEEIAEDWDIDPEQVVQIRAILRIAEIGEKRSSYMTSKKFKEGYKEILQLMQPEELICYMEDKPGYSLVHPKMLLEEIRKEKQ